MITDAISWNMLNLLRVELAFNCYKIYTVFVTSSLQSPRGQYAVISLLICLLAQFAVQFQIGWLLTLYMAYLAVGMASWIYWRVYFYHRRLDPLGINQTIHQFESARALANGTHHSAPANGASSGTLRPDKHHSNGASSSSASSASSSSSANAGSEYTNSLQRQRAVAYRDFQSILSEPRRNHREFALSLTHLSLIAKLFADKDIFDEMHFQILATRRDVVNITLRVILLSASFMLVYLK